MAILKLIRYPNPILSKCAAVVSGKLSKKDSKLIREMIETMYHENGVGLAAPQVNVSRKIIIVSPDAEPGEEDAFINPEIVESSKGEEIETEGCLSLPGISCEVRRAKKIKFKAFDLNGSLIMRELEGFPARVMQHEVDHLNGFLIIDRIDFNKRQVLLGTYRNLSR